VQNAFRYLESSTGWPEKLAQFLYVLCHFFGPACIGVAHECVRQTDRQTEPSMAIAWSNDSR